MARWSRHQKVLFEKLSAISSSYSNLKVILALAFPPSILLLDVKARISNRRMDSLTQHSFMIEGNGFNNVRFFIFNYFRSSYDCVFEQF